MKVKTTSSLADCGSFKYQIVFPSCGQLYFLWVRCSKTRQGETRIKPGILLSGIKKKLKSSSTNIISKVALKSGSRRNYTLCLSMSKTSTQNWGPFPAPNTWRWVPSLKQRKQALKSSSQRYFPPMELKQCPLTQSFRDISLSKESVVLLFTLETAQPNQVSFKVQIKVLHKTSNSLLPTKSFLC